LLKVAFQGSLGFGGLGTVTRELTRHLARYVDISVFDVLRTYHTGLSVSEIEKVPIANLGLKTRFRFNLPFHSIGFRNHDIIHINYAFYGIPALICNQLDQTPFVETVHGIPQPEFERGLDEFGYFAEKCALSLTSRRASSLVSDSIYIREEMRRRYAAKSTTIPLGVDTERFFPSTDSEAKAARKRLAISEGDRVVVYVGRLHPWKDPFTLVRAASLVLKERKDVSFRLVGKGPLLDDVVRLIRILGVQDRVLVASDPDYYNGLTDYYRAADVFVLPTKKEGFGLVVLEAMASGLCVIASDGGAPPELLGDSGLLFRTGDSRSLSETILNVLSDDALRRRLGIAARARAVEMYTWEKCALSYLRLYKQILENDQKHRVGFPVLTDRTD
jgi:glycosyltransferase involved in cell wall biosynthesis